MRSTALAAAAIALAGLGLAAAPAAADEADPDALTTAEAYPTSQGTVEVRIPLPEYVSAMRIRLPELRCPADSPFVADERFDPAGDSTVRFPNGLEPLDSADFTVRATWAPFLADENGPAVSLQGGSVLELEGIEDASRPATFVLHCTAAAGEAVGLGAIAKPPAVDIGGGLRHDLRLRSDVRASVVEGKLPPGLVLGERGDLIGTVAPTSSGTVEFTVRLTDGGTTIDHRLSIVVVGGRVIQHETTTTRLPNWTDVRIPEQGCPVYFPWTVARQFHDPVWSAQKVPNGVQAVTDGGLIEVTSNPVVDNQGLTRGLMHITANYRALSGTGAIHFVLHCTNDANQAGRR